MLSENLIQEFQEWQKSQKRLDYKSWIKNHDTDKDTFLLLCAGLSDFAKCPVCGKEIKTYKEHKPLAFCSIECKNSEQGKKITNQRKQETCLSNYGVQNPSQSEIIKHKKQETCLSNYGVLNPMQSDICKEKSKQTCFNKYGIEYTGSIKEFHEKSKLTKLKLYGNQNYVNNEKAKQTKLEKYGDENYTNIEKAKKTNLSRYGHENVGPVTRDKAKKTMIDRFGVEYSFQSNICREKSKQTCLKKYGTEHASQSNIIKSKTFKTKRKNRFTPEAFANYIKECEDKMHVICLSSLDDYIETGILEFKCKICGEIIKPSKATIRLYTCPKHHFRTRSRGEQEVYEFVRSILPETIEIIQNDRDLINPFEIDILIPEKKIAIEFDGIYWHNNLHKPDDYHAEKSRLIENAGYQSIHIFESEWIEKQEIVKDILKAKLGCISRKIFARNTNVVKLDSKTYTNFVNQYHIQGIGTHPKYAFGLVDKRSGELYEVIGIGKSRFKKGEMELLRHCTKFDMIVIGGFSKLISYWFKIFDGPLYTYCDKRYSNGNSYLKSGWEFVSLTGSNYYYVDIDGGLHNRMEFQKHKLKSKLDFFDQNLTEKENMFLNGYLWVYDCGNMKFKIDKYKYKT